MRQSTLRLHHRRLTSTVTSKMPCVELGSARRLNINEVHASSRGDNSLTMYFAREDSAAESHELWMSTRSQLDLVQVQQAGKYRTGQTATWGESDWDGAPGSEPGNPPQGNELVDQFDVIAALAKGDYMTGAYAATAPDDAGLPRTVPEPSSLLLALLGIIGLLHLRRRYT